MAFVAFSLAASGIYLVNDANDVAADRALVGLQPDRPIAPERRREPGREARPVLALRRRPADLSHRGRAREGHGLEPVFGGDVLSPEVGLQAKDVAALLISQRRRRGLKPVDVAQADDDPAAGRFAGQIGLAVVEVEDRIGGHDHVVAGPDSRHRPVGPMPRGHGRLGGQAAREDVVPAQDTAAMRLQEGFDPLGEAALQGVLVGEAQRLDLGLDRRGGLPLVLHRLVAADGDVAAGKELHHLAEHVLEEPDRRLVVVVDVREYAPVALDAPGRRAAGGKLRVGQHGR